MNCNGWTSSKGIGKQRPLFSQPKEEKPAKQVKGFDQMNLATAVEILTDPEANGGPDGFPAIWARRVIERLGDGQKAKAA